MLRDLFSKIINQPHEDEPEYQEAVEHDTVMMMVDGELVEVTGNDPKVRK